METVATKVNAPVETFTPEDVAHDAQRCLTAESEYLGAVVVGGRASADCFRGIGELQAGVKDPERKRMEEQYPEFYESKYTEW